VTIISSHLGVRFLSASKQGIAKGISTFLRLCFIIVPVFVSIEILKLTPLLDLASQKLRPFMILFGLPGEAALSLISGAFVNIYAGLAAAAGLNLTVRQLTILAVMLGISHSQIAESAVMGQMRAKPYLVAPLRILLSLAVGFLLNLIMPR
jgi:spore maturation protein SpmB